MAAACSGAAQRGRSVGKAITSRIDGLSVNSMTSRSMPMPSPPHGGSPYSSATHVILVERLRLLVAGRPRQHLRLEAGALVNAGR